MKKYARKCDVTGKGMNEGWCWDEGAFYTKTEEATISELRKKIAEGYNPTLLGIEELLEKPDDELLGIAYDEGLFYWTEWNDEDIEEQGYYYKEDGDEVVLSLQNINYKKS
jgi:hypothetical protein